MCLCLCLKDAAAVEKLFCISSGSLIPIFYSLSVHPTQFIEPCSFSYVAILCYLGIYIRRVPAHYLLAATGVTQVCLSLCQGLVGKTKSACSSVSPQDTDYISMSSRPGRGKSQPLRGGRSLGLCCVALLILWVMHCSDRVIFSSLSSTTTKVKSNWLIYLLSVKPSPVSGTR